MKWQTIDTYKCDRYGGELALFCGPDIRIQFGYGYLRKMLLTPGEPYVPHFVDYQQEALGNPTYVYDPSGSLPNYRSIGTPTHWMPLPQPPEFT